MNIDLNIDKLIKGVEIIRKYQPTADIFAGFDCVYFGNETTQKKMTLEERKEMYHLGWYIDEESWMLNL